MALFIILLLPLAHPALALETGSKIYIGEAVIGINESYTLYQGYSIKMIDHSPAGNKINIEIDLEGEPIDKNIFIKKGETYQYTKTYDDETHLILSISLEKVDINHWTAKLKVTQYIDPSRNISDIFLKNEDKTITPGTALSLEQDYSLKVEELYSESAVLALYKQGNKVKEQEMEINDSFDYTVTVNDIEETIITFYLKAIFIGTNRTAVFIHHLYQFKEPENTSPLMTPTAVSGEGNVTGNDTELYNESISSDTASQKGISLTALSLFAFTTILIIIWAGSSSRLKKH